MIRISLTHSNVVGMEQSSDPNPARCTFVNFSIVIVDWIVLPVGLK